MFFFIASNCTAIHPNIIIYLISLTTGATRKGSSLPCKSHIICQEKLKVNKNILTLKSFFLHFEL